MGRTPLKLTVKSNGLLVLDGKTVTIDQFKERINRCDPAKFVVWYHRENPEAPEPPPVAFAAADVMIKQRLSISFSSKPDYSDFVDDKGISHPRP